MAARKKKLTAQVPPRRAVKSPKTLTKAEAEAKAYADEFAKGVALGMRRAAREARKVAKMYGTPIYVWENGRVVAKKP